MHGRRYRVRSGDSLSSIAKAQLGSARRWPRIFAYNNRKDVISITRRPLTNPDKIQIGQLLLLPPPEEVNGRISHAADHRHPRQTQFPHIATQTHQATQGAPAAPPPTPSSRAAGTPTIPPVGGGGTQVNSFPFKYKLDLIPQQTIEGPNYVATLKFEGQVVIWRDQQIPAGYLTNKGLEGTAHFEANGVLAQLVQDEKISWDPATNRASLENMMTINAHGAPPSLTSIGLAIDSDNPIPAMRFKFQAPKLQGRVGQHLYIAENIVITADLRPKPNDDDITRRPDPARVGSPVATPVATPQPWWNRAGQWVADHKVEIGVAVVVTAVVASNFVTAGADAEADPVVGAWAARTLQAAQAARAVAPALAH